MEEEKCLIDSNNNAVNETNHSWIVEIDAKRSNRERGTSETEAQPNNKHAIYKRPLNVSEEKGSFLYTPRIVSFGPYHHEDESFQKTNEIKEFFVVQFLDRSNKKAEDYVKALTADIGSLRNAYERLDPKWQRDDAAFLRLMFFDGCFLIEILREANNLGSHSGQLLNMYGISTNKLMEYYRHDMLLIENQLPLHLLVTLVSVQSDLQIQEAREHLYRLILKFVSSNPENVEKLPRKVPKHMYLHVLDLYRHSLLYQERRSRLRQEQGSGTTHHDISEETSDSESDSGDGWTMPSWALILLSVALSPIIVPVALVSLAISLILCPLQCLVVILFSNWADINFTIIPSATELDKVGIRFQMSRIERLNSIHFGIRTLSLPQIYVDGTTQSRFVNIIAFEQLHADVDKKEVTSYIYFMSRLLQTTSDARLLQLNGIIRTTLHIDQVPELFKSMTKDINVDDPNNFLVENYRKVSKSLTESFYNRMKNPWHKDVWQTYLKSPWAVISILAAFLLFALTSIQTVYTIMSYYNSK